MISNTKVKIIFESKGARLFAKLFPLGISPSTFVVIRFFSKLPGVPVMDR